jgi:hypothetical protein
MIVFTSITKSYIPKARVLAKSLKKHHPDWFFILLLSDTPPPNFDISKEPFDELITIEQLPIENLKSWMFGLSIVELCTAVKGPAAAFIANNYKCDKILYLDPDIKVFNSLQPIDDMLDRYDILLTPHILDSEGSYQAIIDNEICALKHGIYNLGFFATRTDRQGLQFINWWSNRLYLFCHDDIPNGLFTDQRWCDLAPAFFSNLHIIRDIGYNVATWNIAHRNISIKPDKTHYAGDSLLRFYHFTGYDSGAGQTMLQVYASGNKDAQMVWVEYGNELINEGHGRPEFNHWHYAHYDNGETIPKEARIRYRSNAHFKISYPDPFSVNYPSYKSHSHYNSRLNTLMAKTKFTRKLYKSIKKRLNK